MVLVHRILQQKSSKTHLSWTGWSMIEGTTSAFLISLALIRFQVKSNCQRFLVYSVTQSCLTLCDPTDCSPPDSPLHGIFQARILEWVAISSSRRSSWPKDRNCVSCSSCTGRWILYCWTIREAPIARNWI